jgi:hypothetical protein
VKQLASVGKFVFVGTDGVLERWDGEGTVIPLSMQQGLLGNQVVALAPDPERHWVWVLTEGGLGHYDTAKEVYAPLAAPPPSMNIDFAALAKQGASVAPATDGGAWLGTRSGLLYASPLGGWLATPIKEPIQALLRDRSGWLWIATKVGLIVRKPTGESLHVGNSEGCGVADPRMLVELAGDRILAIGADEQGRERLAVGNQLQWATFRALPEVKWDGAARRGPGAVVMAGDRVWRLGPPTNTDVRPLAGGAALDWSIEPVDVQVPVGAVAIASANNDQLLIGTRDLGTARYVDGDARPHDWLRRRAMFRDATNLSVACIRAQDCWIATGARQAWHWMGDRFVNGGPDQTVLAVVRDPAGPLYGLHRANDTTLHVSRIEPNGAWTLQPKIVLSTPGLPEISFGRFATPGTLWLGLRYREGMDTHAYGVAIVDIADGKVTYHRAEELPPDKKSKRDLLPIPHNVIDGDVRGDAAWFATSEGFVRLVRGRTAAESKIDTWTEADGLRSELGRGVAIATDGTVYIATAAGAARWDGKAWDFPAALRFEINDVVATRTGQIWMATERGIAAWDGQKVRRMDTRRGLAENAIIDIAVDQFDRVWARGAGSLTLVTQ